MSSFKFYVLVQEIVCKKFKSEISCTLTILMEILFGYEYSNEQVNM